MSSAVISGVEVKPRYQSLNYTCVRCASLLSLQITSAMLLAWSCLDDSAVMPDPRLPYCLPWLFETARYRLLSWIRLGFAASLRLHSWQCLRRIISVKKRGKKKTRSEVVILCRLCSGSELVQETDNCPSFWPAVFRRRRLSGSPVHSAKTPPDHCCCESSHQLEVEDWREFCVSRLPLSRIRHTLAVGVGDSYSDTDRKTDPYI